VSIPTWPLYHYRMETHIRVVIAEDDHFAVNVLQRYLSGAPSIEVVGIAHDGRQALQIAQELQPDVLITDLYMPWLDGIEVTRRVLADGLTCRVLIFTAVADETTMIKALEAGATGFLLKSDHPHMVVNGVLAAFSGDTLVSPKLITALLPMLRRSTAPTDLSARDREFIALIGKGRSNAEIASETHLAVSTVKSYVSKLLEKFGRPNRTALAALAYEWNLID